MSPAPPATRHAPQDDSALDWPWPPPVAEKPERTAIARLDKRRAVADVSPQRDDHQLQWPPSAADLDSVVAVSLDDDGVRRLASVLVARRDGRPGRRRGGLVPAALAASCLITGGGVAWWALPRSGAEERGRQALVAVKPTEKEAPRRAVDVATARVPPASLRAASEARPGAAVGRRRAEANTRAVAAPTADVPALADLNDTRGELAATPVAETLPTSPVGRVEIAATVPSGALSGAVAVDFRAMPPRLVSSPEAPEARPASADARRAHEEPAIRALLEQYGAAYSRLDARAARAVWPGVNVQALARAFGALESQAIDFERCDVQVDGTVARAACRGTSTWVPRVGERRAHRDAREWTFRLERDRDAQWRIQSASMR